MKVKRLIAIAIAMMISVSAMSFNEMKSYRTQETVSIKNENASNPIMDMAATNSVGKYISQLTWQDEQDKAAAINAYDGNYSIADLVFYPETGTALVKSSQSTNCSIILKIVDEDGNVEEKSVKQTVVAGTDIITEL